MDRSNKHDNNSELGVTPRIRLCGVSRIARKKSTSLTQLASQTENTISPIPMASRISPSVPVITGKSCLQEKPDRAILMLVRALARRAARDDHAREKAKRAAQDEPSRHLHPLLDRSSK